MALGGLALTVDSHENGREPVQKYADLDPRLVLK